MLGFAAELLAVSVALVLELVLVAVVVAGFGPSTVIGGSEVPVEVALLVLSSLFCPQAPSSKDIDAAQINSFEKTTCFLFT